MSSELSEERTEELTGELTEDALETYDSEGHGSVCLRELDVHALVADVLSHAVGAETARETVARLANSQHVDWYRFNDIDNDLRRVTAERDVVVEQRNQYFAVAEKLAAKVKDYECTPTASPTRPMPSEKERARGGGASDAAYRLARVERWLSVQLGCWGETRHPESTEREHWLVRSLLRAVTRAVHGPEAAECIRIEPLKERHPRIASLGGVDCGSVTDDTSRESDGAATNTTVGSGPTPAPSTSAGATTSAAPADASGASERDNCAICLGAFGNPRGNETLVEGVTMCDDCHALSPKQRAMVRAIASAVAARARDTYAGVTWERAKLAERERAAAEEDRAAAIARAERAEAQLAETLQTQSMFAEQEAHWRARAEQAERERDEAVKDRRHADATSNTWRTKLDEAERERDTRVLAAEKMRKAIEAGDRMLAETRAECERLRAERDAARADVIEAAGELLVDVPKPGTDEARIMLANMAMRRERNTARDERDAYRALARKRARRVNRLLRRVRAMREACAPVLAGMHVMRDDEGCESVSALRVSGAMVDTARAVLAHDGAAKRKRERDYEKHTGTATTAT